MNKLFLAAIAGLLSVGAMDAFRHNGGRCCPTRTARSCARTSCAPACAAELVPPRCTKMIEVPKTVMELKEIEVEPEMVRTPNADRIVRHPQPCEEVKIPLPQQYRIEQRHVPDVVEVIKVPDTISYRCPADSTTCGSRSVSCCN